MNLDLRTMMVMIAALSLLFSGLLALAGLHAGSIRGVRQWATGSLLLGLGLAFSYTQLGPPANPWILVLGATLALAGTGFQYYGTRLFKTGYCNAYLPWLVAGAAFAVNSWFVVLHPDIHARVIANSLLFFLINAICAHELFIRMEQPLRTAYWFTGASFSVLAAMFLFRAVVIFLSPDNTYGLYTQIPLNPISFFIGGMAQMAIVFGFVLMLNYRLSADHQRLASTDALTGVMNRRSLELEASRLLARYVRSGETLAVMMIDVDHFKTINDRYGHMVGDEVLRHLTAVAQKSIRTGDYLARYGGEEFCILLPASVERDAWTLAERLRQVFAGSEIEYCGEMLRSTVSIGIADSTHAGLNFVSLLVAADKAMYQAKLAGRNRVSRHSNSVDA
ncbi:GGDEF domain-containing protein [Methylomonas sp. SURF-2]|uniref:diguanylate cyclase n=1 Tax=Methylomonas subterranea TaxID=2952225 RepID=A0ABT1THD0_9GAMM|nr:GGDEF domain-containing protein [Methylomonas sp. SURF-2]MCQ8104179.1 GGDEF domain-containing protein [Methylomonas sp. SURF-2]